MILDQPSLFVLEWVPRIAARFEPTPSALDLAVGRGRHALVLARYGFRTFGVDVNLEAVREAVMRVDAHGLRLHAWCADLAMSELPHERFDVILVTRYLQRDLFESIRQALKPEGIVLYETFTVHQRQIGMGPASPHHLLESGELERRFAGFDVLFHEEVMSPEALARIVAKKR